MGALLFFVLVTAALVPLPTPHGIPVLGQEHMKTPVARIDPATPPTTSEIAVPIECSKCSTTTDCGSDLECYQSQCIKTGELKKISIAKCFPNLKECAMCTKDAQCRSGKCSYSHCVSLEHPNKSLKDCGVSTGVSDHIFEHGDPYGYETGKVEYHFSDGYYGGSFGGYGPSEYYHSYNYYH